MNILNAIVLGILQGITEFFPISSSAHLILMRHWFGWQFPTASQEFFFDLALHAGTCLAIFLFFWRDLLKFARAIVSRDPASAVERRLAWGIVIGSIPAAVVGVFLGHDIENYFRSNIPLICFFLMGVGLLMGLAEMMGKKRRDVSSVKIRDAFWIGCAQALALFPGFSRSGMTIMAGLWMGLEREAAARFSFLLSVPIVAMATVWTAIPVVREGLPMEVAAPVVAGALTSAVVGYLCIAFLLRFLKTRTLWPFVIYRLVIGLATLFFK